MRRLLLVLGLSLVAAGPLAAQDRDTKVRNDRKAFDASRDWIYNDLAEGIRAAKVADKPLFVVLRCIPCEACQEFDDDVARRDPIIADLLDRYVCVRIVQANTLDLAHFQDDYDQSFAVFLMNPDLTLYGRFGTRSERPEEEDISLEGLRKAMVEGLRIHGAYAAIKPALADKQPRPVRYKTPRDYPWLSGKYSETINYGENTARSCLHCHQIREAERHVYRDNREPIPDAVLFPYPDPGVLGLSMDPREMATVSRVVDGSAADRAGFRPGDALATLSGQPLLSVADLQWVLHHTPDSARVAADVRRDGESLRLTLDLPEGWRRRGNISWRATTWDLRRMAFGGMSMQDLDDEGRRLAGLPTGRMALRVRHVGQFGEHAIAKKAGFLVDDVVVAFDGRDEGSSESELIAYALQRKRPGDVVNVDILRDGLRKTIGLALP